MSSMNITIDIDITYYLCGCILTILPVIFLTLYVIILYLFKTGNKEFKTPCYTQLFHMGLTDIIQLLVFLFSGVTVLLQYNIPDGFNNVIHFIFFQC
uniref:G-protein coupled receptors family 1 profile domain-containing protein n=1 Tax=Panagrellus redivivus TaxID=6233 RepID=A0A7E4UMC0_PANRE